LQAVGWGATGFGLAAQGRPGEDGAGFAVEAGKRPCRSNGFATGWPWIPGNPSIEDFMNKIMQKVEMLRIAPFMFR
jgi:hypothetical protein